MCEWLLGWLLCLRKATVSVRVYTGRRHLSPFSQRPEWRQNRVHHVLGVCQCHIVQFQGVPITLYLWQEWASSGLWFLYDQLAKNRAYIFKELLKRRKGVYDRLYVAHKALKCTVHGWAEKALTTHLMVTMHIKGSPWNWATQWLCLLPRNVKPTQLSKGSQPRPRMHKVFSRPSPRLSGSPSSLATPLFGFPFTHYSYAKEFSP